MSYQTDYEIARYQREQHWENLLEIAETGAMLAAFIGTAIAIGFGIWAVWF